MATIKDVAKQAGVSVTAVSRALNNYPDISASTKSRILKVIEELRYYPKASARHLVTQRTHTIGVFYPSFDGPGLRQPFIAHVLDQFKNRMGDAGYDILLFSNTRAPFDHFDLLERVRYRDVDGVLLLGTPDESIRQLVQANVPLVGVDHAAQCARGGSVSSDNRRAIHDLVGVLYDNGYRKLAFVHGPLDLPVSMERLQGFYSGMSVVGLTPRAEWVYNGDFLLEGGERAGIELLRCQDRPDVVVCAADVSAIGVLRSFMKQGIRVPDEISVVGFDDIDAATYVYPQLTTIRQNKDEMAECAARIMVQLIENDNQDIPMHYVLPTELVVRESTRPLYVRPAYFTPRVADLSPGVYSG